MSTTDAKLEDLATRMLSLDPAERFDLIAGMLRRGAEEKRLDLCECAMIFADRTVKEWHAAKALAFLEHGGRARR